MIFVSYLREAIRSLVSKIRLLWLVFHEDYRHIILLMVIGFVGALFDGIGINAIIPLFSSVSGNAVWGEDVVSRWIYSFFIFFHIPPSPYSLVVLIAILFLGKAGSTLLGSYVNLRVFYDYEERMRNRLFGSMLEANWSFLLGQKIGALQTTLMTNLSYASAMLSHIGSIITTLSGLCVYIVIALHISWPLTLLALVLGGILFFLLRPLLARVGFLSEQALMMPFMIQTARALPSPPPWSPASPPSSSQSVRLQHRRK